MARVLLPNGAIDQEENWDIAASKRNCKRCYGRGYQGTTYVQIGKDKVKIRLLCPCVPRKESAPVLVAGMRAEGNAVKEIINGK